LRTILLIGPGAIGSLMAWQLQNSFKVKVHPHRATMNLPSRIAADDTTFPLNWTLADTLDDIDAVLVCCKATQVEQATRPLIPLLNPCPWLILCNGLGPQAWLSQQLPGRVLWASTTEGAGRFGSVVRHTGQGETRLGAPAGYPVTSQTEQWGQRLTKQKGPLTVKWETDITTTLWRKLAVNAVINPITAVHHSKNGELTGSQWQEEIAELSDEIRRVALACDIHLPADLAGLITAVAAATRENQSSMFADISAGRETEVDAILGPLLCEADRHGLSVPRLQYWYQAVIRQHPLNHD
jgi:2-dehydropantoate 2-reductase